MTNFAMFQPPRGTDLPVDYANSPVVKNKGYSKKLLEEIGKPDSQNGKIFDKEITNPGSKKLTLKIEEINPPYAMRDGEKYYRVSSPKFPTWTDYEGRMIYACEGYPKEEVVENFIRHAKEWTRLNEEAKRREAQIEYRVVEL